MNIEGKRNLNTAIPQNNEEIKSSDFSLKLYSNSYLQENMQKLIDPFVQVTSSATGISQSELLSSQEHVMNSWDYALTIENDEKIVAFAGFTYKNFEGLGSVFGGAGKMIRKEFQAEGYGKFLTENGLKQISGEQIDFYRVVTQNPASYISFSKAIKKIFPDTIFAPIDTDYAADDSLRNALSTISDKENLIGVDLTTGKYTGIYSDQGRLGDYKINLTNPLIAHIEKRMQTTGINREQGDGIIFIGRPVNPVSK